MVPSFFADCNELPNHATHTNSLHDQVPEVERLSPELVFAHFDFGDLWEDAKMSEVIRYLWGGESLNLPPAVKACMQQVLW